MDRLGFAERQLDRVHSFFPRIDAKVTAVAAWLSIEVAVAALNTKLDDLSVAYVWVPFSVYVLASAASAARVWQCVFPDSKGGQGSLIYFGAIAGRTEGAFRNEFKAIGETDLLDDVIGQVWRNAEIVCAKYTAVQSSIRWLTISLAALVATLIATSILHHSLPSFPGA
ncbi:MAG TPA: Pycsar system effector family protein [Sphingomonas sp.]|jgi:hypothetical protein